MGKVFSEVEEAISEPMISSISLAHWECESILSAERPRSLTLRLRNSGTSLAKAPSSVVQLGMVSRRSIAGEEVGGVHGSEVSGVGEEDGPRVADEAGGSC